jgi:hypothetical protein
MSGGGGKKESKIHSGQPDMLCGKIMDFLSRNGFLKNDF